MSEVEKIAEEIKRLDPPAKLRLAADLMERRMGRTALPIIESVALELGAVVAMQALTRTPPERMTRPTSTGEPREDER